MEQGEIRPAVDQLSSALALANDSDVADVLRAEVMTKLGVGRLKLGSTTVATGLLTEALKLAEESSYATDRLIVEILHWRCACYQRLKDVESARDDASRALELAAHIADPRMTGQVFLQASLVAEREGRFVVARKYAETAQLKFEEAADEVKVGTILSNLGIYQFLLGKPDEALATFQKAYSILLDAGDLREHPLHELSRPHAGRQGRRREGAGRPCRCSRALQARNRTPPRHPVLERKTMKNARLISLAITVMALAAFLAGHGSGGGHAGW
jgi:Tfp pilus assembly protein PilF